MTDAEAIGASLAKPEAFAVLFGSPPIWPRPSVRYRAGSATLCSSSLRADLSYDEIAIALGVPVGTVGSRITRARSCAVRTSTPIDHGRLPTMAELDLLRSLPFEIAEPSEEVRARASGCLRHIRRASAARRRRLLVPALGLAVAGATVGRGSRPGCARSGSARRAGSCTRSGTSRSSSVAVASVDTKIGLRHELIFDPKTSGLLGEEYVELEGNSDGYAAGTVSVRDVRRERGSGPARSAAVATAGNRPRL
jgi:Sigma-70, region 4